MASSASAASPKAAGGLPGAAPEAVGGNLYAIIGTDCHADLAEIKACYRQKARHWHPDKNLVNKEHAAMMFQLVTESYAVLSDPQKREQYDFQGKLAGKRCRSRTPPKVMRLARLSEEQVSAFGDKCLRCGERGHWAKECPSSGLSQAQVSTFGNRCRLCNMPGHWKSECPIGN